MTRTAGARRRKPGRKSRQRIAIVGANFAGLTAAQQLGPEHAVTVLDSSPWFEWLPNIHELVSGIKRPTDLRLSRARLVARAGHKFVRATVDSIDAPAGRLATSSGRRIDFDVCIVAVGGVSETFGVRGVEANSRSFKSVADCAAIGRELERLTRRSGRKSVVIVGGGLEGVEALGEILRRYREVPDLDITVVEAGPRLLGEAPARLDGTIREHCSGLAVRILTRSPVTAVTPKRVRLRSKELLRSDLTIWTGGATAAPLLHESGLSPEPGQWAPVTRALLSTRFDNVFVIGDAAALPKPLDKQAYYAMQMGACAAGNVRRVLAGRAPRRFSPSPKPMLIAFGDLDTFLVSGRSVLASPKLAALKETVFQVTMAEIDPPLNAKALRGLSNRLAGVALQLDLPAGLRSLLIS